jgi:hypothetical protein
MKIIGVIGYIDKVDYIISMAKTLELMGKAVLVIDSTADKKYKYIIPALNTTEKEYVTEFNKVDYAVGFESMNDVENYMCSQKVNISLYDYVIIDIDNDKSFEFFRTRGFDRMYFFVDSSVLSLEKNKEILNSIKIYNSADSQKTITRVLYRQYITRTSEKYFENKLNELEFAWDEKEYEIYEDEQDRMLYIDFQISGIVQIKKHSGSFVNSLSEFVAQIMEDVKPNDVKKAIKKGGI